MNRTIVNNKRLRYLFRIVLPAILILCAPALVSAQQDTTAISTGRADGQGRVLLSKNSDSSTAIIVHQEVPRKGLFAWKDSLIIPKRSAMYSMLFPGLGQINNGQYWKLPIVYGLLGAGIYFFQDNLKNYNQYRAIYANRLNNIYTDKYVNIYDDANIKNARDFYKKYLDMTVMLAAVGYGLQIMDANVFAHLKHFDISDDIAFRFKPSFQPTPWGISPGVGVAFNFK